MSARSVSLPMAVAVVLAVAVVAMLVGPARGGTPEPAGRPTLSGAELSAVLAPALDCPDDLGVVVDAQEPAPRTLDDPALLVAARCDAGAGNPPSGVFLVRAGDAGAQLAATLVPDTLDLVLPHLAVTDDAVTVTADGFSAPDVPRCCPDRTVVRTWAVGDGTLEPVGA
ncbi:MAG: hypothetical protein MUC45_00250 [Actinomycetia bacterium]|jgi:hypothetical protein|nr:hypothetical protein [Actinomycetes bacterium]